MGKHPDVRGGKLFTKTPAAPGGTLFTKLELRSRKRVGVATGVEFEK